MTSAALFDFDGVVVDTEGQYSQFWKGQATKYGLADDLFLKIKGSTLTTILNTFFPGQTAIQESVAAELVRFEEGLRFDFIPGVVDFISEIRSYGVRTALVTSSDINKMNVVYARRPEVRQMFDAILIADMFTHSKPDPECYLMAARQLDVPIENCYVFEDSLNGLESGNRAGMKVIGLSTTNPVSAIRHLCWKVIPDFSDIHWPITYEL